MSGTPGSVSLSAVWARELTKPAAAKCSIGGRDVGAERGVGEDGMDEPGDGVLVGRVGRGPGGALLRLAQGLDHEGGEAVGEVGALLGVERPGAGEGLEEQPGLGRAGGGVAERGGPAGHGVGPGGGVLAERGEAGAGVLAALGVVGGGGGEGGGPAGGARLHRGVEGGGLGAEMRGLGADLVERDQAVVAVEDGVLDGLGGQGAGELLEAAEELEAGGVGAFGEQEAGHEVEHAAVLGDAGGVGVGGGGLDEGAVLGRGRAFVAVAAVDGEGGEHLDEGEAERVAAEVAGAGGGEREGVGEVGEGGELACEVDGGEAALGVEDLGVEVGVGAGGGGPGVGEGGLGGGVGLERGEPGGELVAGGAGGGPVGAEVLVRAEDLLDEHGVEAGGGAEVVEVLLRVGEAVDVVDAQAVDDAVADELERRGGGRRRRRPRPRRARRRGRRSRRSGGR
jgi:hypothetical protein